MVLEKKIKKELRNKKSQNKIGVVADDVCSLPEEFLKKNRIEIVKMRLFFEELKKQPEKDIYQIMKETKAYPKTSAPSPGQFLKSYNKALKINEKIVVITISSKLSGAFNTANQAKKLISIPSKINIVDSFSAVAAEGLLVIKAINLIKEKKDLKKIKNELETVKKRIKMFAFLETTYWVEKIGRISKKRAFGFKFLKLFGVMPIIGIKREEVGLVGFNFWTTKNYKAVFHQLKKETKRAKKQSKRLIVGINYTDNKDTAFWLKEKIERKLQARVIFVSMVPLIVGANSGPGTLIAASYIE
ncbi:MAG: DegV family protein [Candidatus Pacebacteria bacterium]|nr:DegV family protein [Candidatus Paceibacterota bacterium]